MFPFVFPWRAHYLLCILPVQFLTVCFLLSCCLHSNYHGNYTRDSLIFVTCLHMWHNTQQIPLVFVKDLIERTVGMLPVSASQICIWDLYFIKFFASDKFSPSASNSVTGLCAPYWVSALQGNWNLNPSITEGENITGTIQSCYLHATSNTTFSRSWRHEQYMTVNSLSVPSSWQYETRSSHWAHGHKHKVIQMHIQQGSVQQLYIQKLTPFFSVLCLWVT